MKKTSIILTVITLICVSLGLMGFTYSFYLTQITGNESASSVLVDIGTLQLVFTDSDYIGTEDIMLGWSETKDFTVQNTGTLKAYYAIKWNTLTNTLVHKDGLIYNLYKDDVLVKTSQVESTGTSIPIYNDVSIEPGVIHTYRMQFIYNDMPYDQSSNMDKKFNGRLIITEPVY